MRERLYVRPEIAAFETPLRRRITRLSRFENDRFARPCGVERDPATGELAVVAQFVAGSRLSDVIEAAEDAAVIPGVDAAFGFLLDVLPALTDFHSTLGFSHGVIDGTRIVLTPDGRVRLLDTGFGEIVERLRLPATRLWSAFGLAAPPSSDPIRLDAAADLRQAALAAVTLALGRRFRVSDYRHAISTALAEVVDVAEIRVDGRFAAAVRRFFHRCLSMGDGDTFPTAGPAASELRGLLRGWDIGEDDCARALREFALRMAAAEDEVRGEAFAGQSHDVERASRPVSPAAVSVSQSPLRPSEDPTPRHSADAFSPATRSTDPATPARLSTPAVRSILPAVASDDFDPERDLPSERRAPIPMPVFPVPPVVARAAVPSPAAPPVAGGTAVPITPVAATPTAAGSPVVPRLAGLRLKAEPPDGFKPPRPPEPLPMPYVPQGPLFGAQETNGFPWRLAAVLLGVVAVAVAAGRVTLPSGAAPPIAQAALTAAPVAVETPAPPAEAAADAGAIVVRSQPSGVRVLLDGKPAGTTPLTLPSVPAGRHELTFVSSSGEVTRSVRVAAGESIDVDVPVFSGWLAVFAPVVLDISMNGRLVGTTQQDRLMLPPGRHQLTLTNGDLGYEAVQTVEIEPGAVRSVTIEPRGRVNLNATPWAEVWLDGQKLGDTPLAGVEIALGVREFVFRHPEHGERKTVATVRADQATAVSVDFTRSNEP